MVLCCAKEIGMVQLDKTKAGMEFGKWIDFWYQQYVKITLRPTTQSEYESLIYKHIIPEIGNIELNKLTQNELQQFYSRLKPNGRQIRTQVYVNGLSDRMVRACHTLCRKSLEKADCKHIRFHDLRHTFATTALANGMDIKTLSAIIGHNSAETTLNIYTHITDEMQRTAADKIERGIMRNMSLSDKDEKVFNKTAKIPCAPKLSLSKIKEERAGQVVSVK